MPYDSLTIFLCVAVISVTLGMTITFGKKKLKFEPEGKHCYIGGASQGLGLALAELLVKRNCHVTIVSRSQKKLDEALTRLEASRASKAQKIAAISADLSSYEGANQALDDAARPFEGRTPDYVFSCTGGAGGILGYHVELTEQQLRSGFETNYLTAMWTAHAAARRMVKQGVSGGIILTSSVLGFFALPGYSAYTPAKHALRGLAESLRIEMLMYDISVHCYFPATIHSPGFEEEQKCKPQLTKNIEGPDEGLSPEECAKRLVKGLERREFLITSDGISTVFRNSMRGIAPLSQGIKDVFLGFIAPIILPIWRRHMDREVLEYAEEHRKEVVDKL